MKIKTSYIYIVLAAAAVIFLFFFTSKDNSTVTEDNISGKEIPQDDVHKGMQVPGEAPPTKDNVNENVKKQLEVLKSAVDNNPGDTLKIREYADYLAAAHKQDMAIELYEKILKKDPRRKDILFSLSFIYYNKQDYNKSEETTNRILVIDKNDLQAQYNLGALAASRGDKEKAKFIWNKMLKDNPGSDISELVQESLNKL